jgi:hypothetical protein
MRQKKITVHYVDNKKFFEEILKYRAGLEEAKSLGKEEPRLPEYIGECIFKIAHKLSTMPRFINYSYRDEMISDGIENCIMYFKDYNPEIGQNPFAYFTQIIYYAFLRRIGKEEKNRYIIYKNYQESIVNKGDSHILVDSDDNHLMPTQIYDNISEFMEKFERKEEEKKIKRKQSKEGLQKFYEEDNNETGHPVPS